MSRPLTVFEQKSILDYNKAPYLNAIRYNCVRAKELDDAQGAPQTGSFFTSMLDLSNAIRVELGLAEAALAGETPVATVADDGGLQAKIDEQEEELEQQDEDLVANAAEIADLKAQIILLTPKTKVAKKPTTKKGAKS
jgi:hypothetical protein